MSTLKKKRFHLPLLLDNLQKNRKFFSNFFYHLLVDEADFLASLKNREILSQVSEEYLSSCND